MVPTAWLAKVKLTGERLTAGVGEPATALPDRETVQGELLALLVSVILPVKLPAVVGAKVTLKVAVLPAVKVSGSKSPLMLKPAPDTEDFETVMAAPPRLLSEMV